jgi:hypothetical protein
MYYMFRRIWYIVRERNGYKPHHAYVYFVNYYKYVGICCSGRCVDVVNVQHGQVLLVRM